jgi:hypothetical protein
MDKIYKRMNNMVEVLEREKEMNKLNKEYGYQT